MQISLHTTIRRAGLALATASALGAVLASSALAETPPAASFYTPQQLQAMSERWAAKGRYTPAELRALRVRWDAAGIELRSQLAPAASFYTPQQLQAMSERWAAKGRYTPAELQALRVRWDAAGRLLASQNAGVSMQASPSGFDWGDFGAGAGAGIGFLLLAGGLAAGVHYGRRRHFRFGSTA
jgi:hypothetical protein